MKNNEKQSEEKQGFMQGWGLILLIIIGTIAALVGLKALMGW